MIKILSQKLTTILVTTFCLIGLLYFGNLALAANLGDAFWDDDSFLGKAAEEAGYDINENETETIISLVIQTALSFLGVVFLILMIYGGYLWMTARGNEDQVAKAKNLITAAIIGLIIVVSAYAISWFVVSKLGGETLEGGGSTGTQQQGGG